MTWVLQKNMNIVNIFFFPYFSCLLFKIENLGTFMQFSMQTYHLIQESQPKIKFCKSQIKKPLSYKLLQNNIIPLNSSFSCKSNPKIRHMIAFNIKNPYNQKRGKMVPLATRWPRHPQHPIEKIYTNGCSTVKFFQRNEHEESKHNCFLVTNPNPCRFGSDSF